MTEHNSYTTNSDYKEAPESQAYTTLRLLKIPITGILIHVVLLPMPASVWSAKNKYELHVNLATALSEQSIQPARGKDIIKF